MPSNAGRQARRWSASVTAVACTPLIMIEASPSAYYWGMLTLGKSHLLKRRRPHAILHPTAPILLRHRSACPDHVPLYPEPGRGDYVAPQYEGPSRDVAQGHCAVS